MSSDPAAAEDFALQAIELAGGEFPEAQLLRSRALLALHRGDEALGSFGLIRSPERRDQESLLNLAAEAQAARQELLAHLALEAANRPGPRQADVLKMLIAVERHAAPSDDLLAHCKLLESLAPDDPLVWQTEARLRRARKEALPALAAYRQALRLEVDERSARILRDELAGALIDSGELDEARAIVDGLLASGPASPELLTKHAYLLRLEGRPADALAAIEEVFDEAPSLAARMLQGVLQLDVGRFNEAAASLELVVAEQPLNKEAHYKLSQAYTKLGQTEKARFHLQENQRLTQAAIDGARSSH